MKGWQIVFKLNYFCIIRAVNRIRIGFLKKLQTKAFLFLQWRKLSNNYLIGIVTDIFCCCRNGLGKPSKVTILRSVMHQSSSLLTIENIKIVVNVIDLYISNHYGLYFAYRQSYCQFPVHHSNDNYTSSALTSFIIIYLSQNYLQVLVEDILSKKKALCYIFHIIYMYMSILHIKRNSFKVILHES